MEAIEKNEIIKIEYSQPKFWHRVLANLVDIVIFVFLFFTVFLFARFAVTHSKSYDGIESRIDSTRVDSGLYIATDDGPFELVSYVENYESTSSKSKKLILQRGINKFLTYIQENGTDGSYKLVLDEYTTLLSDSKYNGVSYFVFDGNNYIENEECTANDIDYYSNIYKPFYSKCLGYLVTYVPNYYSDMKYMSNMFFFLEFPISLFVSAFLTWFVPPIFFRRGRKTLGKALYHIGLVNNECLNPSFGVYALRFVIFFFAELVLAFFTFGLPFIISFSLMSFSKNRQGFPDYMLRLTEIDNSKNKIYFDKVEIALDNNRKFANPVDFNMEKPL